MFSTTVDVFRSFNQIEGASDPSRLRLSNLAGRYLVFRLLTSLDEVLRPGR